MVQSVSNQLSQAVYGFEASSRFDASASKRAGAGSRSENSGDSSASKKSEASTVTQLTPEEERIVKELKRTDIRVREHEQAHITVGADLILGRANFSYETGPDNKRYAEAGEVSIDTSPGRTPEETIPKAQHIRETALAPVDPSAQDRRVAVQASVMEVDARGELAAQRNSEAREAATETKPAADGGEGRGSAGFYRGVQQASAGGSRVGGSFDSFA